MNLIWYIIYQDSITNIWQGQKSVCREATVTKLLRCYALHLVSSAENQALHSLSMETQAANGPKGLCKAHCEMNYFSLPSCKATVCPLLNILKNKGLGWKEATKKIHYYSMPVNYYENQSQLRPQKMSPKHWLVSMDWWMCGVLSPTATCMAAWATQLQVFEGKKSSCTWSSSQGIPSFSWLGLFLISIQSDFTQIPAFPFQDVFTYLFCLRWDTFL